MEKWIFSYWHNNFFSTSLCVKRKTFPQGLLLYFEGCLMHSFSFSIPQKLVEKPLKTGVDICGNIPDVVLQIGIITLKCNFYFADSVEDGGMIFTKFFTNVRQT